MCRICEWYIKMWLRRHKCVDWEIVVTIEGTKLRKRDFEREAIVKHAIERMKERADDD